MSESRWQQLEVEYCAAQRQANWRTEKVLHPSCRHPEIEIAGRHAIDFSSNHYLGLGIHPRVITAMQATASQYGAGAFASRLISGTLPIHKELEQQLAAHHQQEDAVLFPSGFLANASILPALTNQDDLILSDALNHASLIEGCRLSRAKVIVIKHSSLEAYQQALQAHRQTARRCFLVTDSVFSMDGDEAPLLGLSSLAVQYDSFLYLDEAHATGVYGPQGRGLAAENDIRPDILVGTLGKALGCIGAYVTSKKIVCDLLRNRARGYVYTTALSPVMAAAALEALRISETADEARRSLSQACTFFRAELQRRGIPIPNNTRGPILPLLVGDDNDTMRLSRELLAQGIFLHGIRPPTVPLGTSRLRLTLLATHTEAHLQHALHALETLQYPWS